MAVLKPDIAISMNHSGLDIDSIKFGAMPSTACAARAGRADPSPTTLAFSKFIKPTTSTCW